MSEMSKEDVERVGACRMGERRWGRISLPLHILLALAAATAAPVNEPTAAKPRPAQSAQAKAKPAVDEMPAMATMLKLFDKFLTLRVRRSRPGSRSHGKPTVMFPKGAFGQAMTGFANRTVDRVLDMSEADFSDLIPPTKGKGFEGRKAGPPSTDPLRLMLAKKEPNFDAKLAALRAFTGAMFVKFGDAADPSSVRAWRVLSHAGSIPISWQRSRRSSPRRPGRPTGVRWSASGSSRTSCAARLR